MIALLFWCGSLGISCALRIRTIPIHAPARGMTRSYGSIDERMEFQLTRHEGRDFCICSLIFRRAISTHAPAKDATAELSITRLFFRRNFNPRAREGRKYIANRRSSLRFNFNSCTREGRDRFLLLVGRRMIQFQSTRPQWARLQFCTNIQLFPGTVIVCFIYLQVVHWIITENIVHDCLIFLVRISEDFSCTTHSHHSFPRAPRGVTFLQFASQNFFRI